MQSQGHYDVIIVGGGVIGAAIAYELSGLGANVAIIEKNHPASGASGAAGGMLAAESEHFAHDELYRLALFSRSLYPALNERLHDITGIDIGLRSEGFLIPVKQENEEQRIRGKRRIEKAKQSGMEWWDSERLFQEEPYIRIADGMLYNPSELQLVPAKLNEALIAASIHQGATVYRQTEVNRLLRDLGKQGQIRGVVTNQGIMYADQVVLASALGTERLLEIEGWRLPFLPVKGELLEIRATAPWLNHTFYGENLYMIPKSPDRIWVGATSRPGRQDTVVEAGSVAELLLKAQQYIPVLPTGELVRCWAGIRPGTPDELPYIGPLSAIPGLWLATGHYRNGILLAAGTAQVIAGALSGTRTEGVASVLLPDRVFQSNQPVH